MQLLRAVAAGEIDARATLVIGGDGVEGLSLLVPHVEAGNGSAVEVAVGGVTTEHDQTARTGERKRCEKHFVHNSEDGGIGADPEGQRNNRGVAKPGVRSNMRTAYFRSCRRFSKRRLPAMGSTPD